MPYRLASPAVWLNYLPLAWRRKDRLLCTSYSHSLMRWMSQSSIFCWAILLSRCQSLLYIDDVQQLALEAVYSIWYLYPLWSQQVQAFSPLQACFYQLLAFIYQPMQVLTLTQELLCEVVVFPWAPGTIHVPPLIVYLDLALSNQARLALHTSVSNFSWQ